MGLMGLGIVLYDRFHKYAKQKWTRRKMIPFEMISDSLISLVAFVFGSIFDNLSTILTRLVLPGFKLSSNKISTKL